MSARRGQVAVYLAFVLVAIAFLVLMNVNVFLAVRAKNRTMNGGDAAAKAVARYQGELLNRIGALNVEHLEAARDGDGDRCDEIVLEQLELSFLEPLAGIRIGNRAAKDNGIERSDDMLKILKDHVFDVRTIYMRNPELYPEPWEGAWEDYARRLEAEISEGIWAGPDNIEFVDAAKGHLLLDQQFYHAIASRSWCWFHFNATGLLDAYSDYHDWGPLPSADEETRRRRSINSEVYSLHLDLRVGSAVELFGTNVIHRLIEIDDDALAKSELLHDPLQKWITYDYERWRKWTEISPDFGFPSIGNPKPEYDVRGCAAVCRVRAKIPDIVSEGEARESVWSGAAKPFGTVEGEDGGVAEVTSLNRLVTSAFDSAHLAPLDTLGGRDLSTADPDWMEHVRKHLAPYLKNGPDKLSSCGYCRQLVEWEREILRRDGARWLKYHSGECRRGSGSYNGAGGTPHGH